MITARVAEQWDLELDDVFVTIGHRFGRVELRRRMRDYVRGLLAPVARKNCWQLAEQAGHATRRTAKVPNGRGFATKGELARHIVPRSLASPLPIAWVTTDAAYGQESRLRRLLEQSGVGYVPAVPKSQFTVGCPRIDGLFAKAPAEAGRRSHAETAPKSPVVAFRCGDRTLRRP
ncbi:SRSO17 transposase [Streptomyces griseochromogenes]|uniref:SRSO17 transposase n=1 Tax=Streptomyces griseochromogenes TaxID=68214 RepID=A0ABS4MAE5_9ACTN|nr:transposase [Streptomyces griseochromogenes]MBP2056633.1 SRSO17 transposase [Streptomyces griseochromogenes]